MPNTITFFLLVLETTIFSIFSIATYVKFWISRDWTNYIYRPWAEVFNCTNLNLHNTNIGHAKYFHNNTQVLQLVSR